MKTSGDFEKNYRFIVVKTPGLRLRILENETNLFKYPLWKLWRFCVYYINLCIFKVWVVIKLLKKFNSRSKKLPYLSFNLKVQSCKLRNNKYMITLTQITNTEIFAFIAVLVFKVQSRKVLFINRKDNRNC